MVTDETHLALQGAGEGEFDVMAGVAAWEGEVGGQSFRTVEDLGVFVRFADDPIKDILNVNAAFPCLANILLDDGTTGTTIVVQVDGLVVRLADSVHTIQSQLLEVLQLVTELPPQRRPGDGALLGVYFLRTVNVVPVDEVVDDGDVARQDLGVGLAQGDDTVHAHRRHRADRHHGNGRLLGAGGGK